MKPLEARAPAGKDPGQGQWLAHLPLAAACTLLLAALVFGGGSRGLGDAVVHAVAVLAFAVACFRWRVVAPGRLQRATLWILAGGLVVGALQLVPLPQDAVSQLPQRAGMLSELRNAGLDPGWLPMTLDRWGTVRALLALFSFLAMWMLCTTLPKSARIGLLHLALAVAVPMALLGFAQASAKLDTTGANGLFENRNHYASLMAMLLPFAFAAARQARERNAIGLGMAWYAAIVLLLVAAALSFSRVGSLLALVAAVAAFLVIRGGRATGPAPRMGALAALAVATLAAGYFASDKLLQRFSSNMLDDLRWQYFANGWEVLRAYFPWGSGFGSFRQVYAQFEPLESLGEFTFANHAHNELIQNAIEGGLPALVLMGAFASVVAVAAAGVAGRGSQADYWQRAALVSVAVVLLHSLVDYPLRTLACGAVLALALSVLLPGGPPGNARKTGLSPQSRGHLQ